MDNTQLGPTLASMLNDPIIIALMESDGVSRYELVALLDKVRRNRRLAVEHRPRTHTIESRIDLAA